MKFRAIFNQNSECHNFVWSVAEFDSDDILEFTTKI